MTCSFKSVCIRELFPIYQIQGFCNVFLNQPFCNLKLVVGMREGGGLVNVKGRVYKIRVCNDACNLEFTNKFG